MAINSKKALLAGCVVIACTISNFASAQDSSPYLVGHWSLSDTFTEEGTTSSITTENTEFVFLNPTNLTLTLEYAFFGEDGTFCGCDIDTLQPNGRVRYSMAGELAGGQLITGCKTKDQIPVTDGTMKTIVFTKEVGNGNVLIDNALQAGYQIKIFKNNTSSSDSSSNSSSNSTITESDLKAVDINSATRDEINTIHQQCKGFKPTPPTTPTTPTS